MNAPRDPVPGAPDGAGGGLPAHADRRGDTAHASPAVVAETARLVVRWFDPHDAGFVLTLVNEPSWIRFIGDRGIRDAKAALDYLERGPIDSYRKRGFGLNCVALRSTGEPIGMCGLIRRETLADVDLGFAFLPEHWGRGYAHEAAAAVLDHGRRVLDIGRVVAILTLDNERSAKLLRRLGFLCEGTIRLPPDGEELLHYATQA